jgi:leader peptidase (prepilin peptidase)/N-methyltransferase
MTLVAAVYAGLMGMALGSFGGLVADRSPGGESIFAKRSQCSNDRCGHVLGWAELVPVLSYVWLRGRCRACGTRIPPRLVFVEIGMGFVFAAVAIRYGLSPGTSFVCAAATLLLVISLIDWDHSLILDKLTAPGVIMAIGFAPFAPWATDGAADAWIGSATGVAVGFLALFPISFFAPNWLEFGDVKLAGLIGGMTGFPLVGVAIWSGIVFGGVVGATLLVTRIRKRGQHIPFGPYMAVGGLGALMYGRSFLDWYLELLRTGF